MQGIAPFRMEFTGFIRQDKGLVILGFPCNQVFFNRFYTRFAR